MLTLEYSAVKSKSDPWPLWCTVAKCEAVWFWCPPLLHPSVILPPIRQSGIPCTLQIYALKSTEHNCTNFLIKEIDSKNIKVERKENSKIAKETFNLKHLK